MPGRPLLPMFMRPPGLFSRAGSRPQSFCELVQTEKVNATAMVPTMLAMLIEYPDFHKYDLSSLTTVGTGGAALPLGLKAKPRRCFPDSPSAPVTA